MGVFDSLIQFVLILAGIILALFYLSANSPTDDLALGITKTDLETLERVITVASPLREAVIVHYYADVAGESFNLRLKRSDYTKYQLKSHLSDTYATFITPDEPQLDEIRKFIKEDILDNNYTEYELADAYLDFVQNVPYEADVDDYAKYPLETLGDGAGDCEDLSILYASLLKAEGYDVILIDYDNIHMGVGIVIEPQGVDDAAAVEYEGKLYYYAETTGTTSVKERANWKIGQQPIFNEVTSSFYEHPITIWAI